jgi:hypothetical protein
MADLVITAANVRILPATTTNQYTAGATVTPGALLAQDSTTKRAVLANATNADLSKILGVATNYADDGDTVVVAIRGDMDLGAALAQGELYTASATGGAIAVYGDLVATNYVSVAGIGVDAGTFRFDIFNSGIQKA